MALEITSIEQLESVGMAAPHLIQDVLAAAALARARGVSPEEIFAALQSFVPDKHRVQVLTTHREVLWIDDSKATNSHAAEASLKSFKNIVWILGGLLKGQNLDDLISAHSERLRHAVVIGTDREEILKSLREHASDVPVIEIVPKDDQELMQLVVEEAAGVALPGDVVLLSPAAASMDQFKSYEDRGQRFQDALRAFVMAHEDGEGGENDHSKQL